MKIKSFLSKLSSFFSSAMVVLIASLFVVSIVYAGTTIGANIATTGSLDVDGTSSSTSATTTYYVYIGADITEPTGWDFGLGDLLAGDDAYIGGQATTSVSLWIGSGGAANNPNMAGGDLYVQNDAEIDGTLYYSVATGTSATSTAYTMIGVTPSTFDAFNYAGGDLYVQGVAEIDGTLYYSAATGTSATSTAYTMIGVTPSTFDAFNYAGGDLYVQGVAEIDGTLYYSAATGTSATSTAYTMIGVTPSTFDAFNYAGGDLYVQGVAEIDSNVDIGGYASTTGDVIVSGGTFSLGTTTATTTAGLFVGATGVTGTTTISVGVHDATSQASGCLEMSRIDDGTAAWYSCYVNTAGNGIICQTGRCN